MIASERKPLEEILEYLKDEKKIFVVACDGCSAGCEVSDAAHTKELIGELEAHGKEIAGLARVEMVCNSGLVALLLAQQMDSLNAADSILVLSCGVGIQSVAGAVEKPVHPGTNSIYLGGHLGLWRSEPRCAECGNCMLDFTGGICPYTACAKSLLYGVCGGPKDGKCEVDPDVPCGWVRIYERVAALGREERLKAMPPLRNFRSMLPEGARRRTSLWALELEDMEEEAVEASS